MKNATNQKMISRRHLADRKLGMSYKERLVHTKVEVKTGKFKIDDYKNGYAAIKRKRLD